LDRLEKELAEVVPEPLLRASLTRLWWFSQRLEQATDAEVGRLGSLVAMEQVLCDRICPQWHEAYMEVDEWLRQAVRASSAVEGVNSVVRMHQGRHRHVSQEMLDLKRLYWNCRIFREGKRKRHSPYALLGLQLPTSDWWQLLQMDPEELEQKLLTQ
jgi:hypothetical protein